MPTVWHTTFKFSASDFYRIHTNPSWELIQGPDVVTNVSYLPFGPLAGFSYANGQDVVYSYDQDHRVTDIETTDGVTGVQDLAYSYDAAGNAKQIADAVDATRTQDFSYDLLYCLTEADGAYGNTAYIHSDHLGTPQKMTDAGGSIVWDRVARPFGATHSESGSLATDLRFPGQFHDAESGLHYNTFCDYDPTLGRYIQSDPIGLQGGINSYGYALGNPTRYTDPSGQSVAAACLTGIVAEPGPFSELACAGYGIYRGIRLLSEMVDEDDLPQSKAETTEADACEEENYNDDFCENNIDMKVTNVFATGEDLSRRKVKPIIC